MLKYISLSLSSQICANIQQFKNISRYCPLIIQHNRKMCELAVENNSLFQGVTDRFDGVTVDSRDEQCDENNIQRKVSDSLQKWIEDTKRTIWFKVDINDAHWVPVLANHGFNFHHARDSFVMMYKWLPDSQHNLPPAAHTNLGVGAIVINDDNQILVVHEKHYNIPHWKIPGGYVERGEDIIDGALREVKEETGIDTEFTSVVGFRHAHNMMFGNSDLYVVVHLKPKNLNITKSEREIEFCKWMDVDEYLQHPHVHSVGRLIVQKAIDYKRKGIRIDSEKITLKLSLFIREMNVFTITE